MKAWSDFFKDVLVHVPGCPEPVAEHAIKRAAQEFFETTRVWKCWLPDITTSEKVTDYPMMLATKTQLVRLERATLNGRPIRVRGEQQLPDDWRTYTQGIEDGVHTSDMRTLTLLPAQCAGLIVKVEVSVKPDENALGVDDRFFGQSVSAIAAGAVASLKEHQDKTYSDANGAMTWRAKFLSAMGVEDMQRLRGYSSMRPRRMVKTF